MTARVCGSDPKVAPTEIALQNVREQFKIYQN